MTIFKGGKGRDDTFTGTDANDRFLFDPVDLTSGDAISGGQGTDILIFATAGTIGGDALANVRGVERVQLAKGENTLILADAMVGSAAGARVAVLGASGNDRIDASALTGSNAITVLAGKGDDTLAGGAGADVFDFATGTLTEADAVNGGTGEDTLILGDQKTVTEDMLAGVRSIEVMQLGDGGTKVFLSEELVTSANRPLTVLGGAGNDQIDVSGVLRDYLQVGIVLNGGAGDDVIQNEGGRSATGVNLAARIDGGAGADVIDMTGAGSAAVVYDGGDRFEIVSRGTLLVGSAATINLSSARDQSTGDAAIVRGFTSVDASMARAGVTLTGTGRDSNFYGAEQLVGGRGNDIISNAARITGGGGADTLTGAAGVATVFTLNDGDFARGESIIGRSGDDRLAIYGAADLTKGTVSGIRTLDLHAGLDGSQARVTIGADQVAGPTYLQGAGEVIVELGRQHDYVLNSLYDQSLGEVGVTVVGSAAADTIDVGRTDLKLSVSSGGGDDAIAATTGAISLDGGEGVDTLRLVGGNANVEIDLSRVENQGVIGTGVLNGFENVDATGLATGGTVVIRGSDDANELRGTFGQSTVAGEAGDDVLAGGNSFGATTTLDGGSGNDVLLGTGENAHNIMTGGQGEDTFRWSYRSSDPQFDNLDVVTDFKSGQDHLEFAAARFDFTGDAFDTRVVARSAKIDVTGADLVIYTGGTLDSIDDVAAYIDAAKNGNESGFFIAGSDSAGHTVLYHALAGETADLSDITAIADLGSTRLTSLALTDFNFI